MGCPNRKSSEFKNLAKRNNIDINTLAIITQQYWAKTKSENTFPSDVYIQAQLGKGQYVEPGKNVRELWKKYYSTPQTFNTREELQVELDKVLECFDPSAVFHYKNSKGEYVLSVKEPVENLNQDINSFLRKEEFTHFNTELDNTLREKLNSLITSNKEILSSMKEEEMKVALKDILLNNLEEETAYKMVEAIDNMSKRQILNELDSIQQENTDFNLITDNSLPDEIQLSIENPQISDTEVWSNVEKIQEPSGRREITYNLPGQAQQTYYVENGHIYNKEGKENKEVYVGESMRTRRNKILANLAVKEGRATVVFYRGNKYVVDNHKNILSGASGEFVYAREGDGNRREILKTATEKFRKKLPKQQPIQSTQQTITPEIRKQITNQIVEHIKSLNISVKLRADMTKYFQKLIQKGTDVSAIQQAFKEQREMIEIKEKAIADGTFMKAPNGKPSNLNERQWLQVRTKPFINWFGDWIKDPANASKVVDENGEPLVVYHATPRNWTVFKMDSPGRIFPNIKEPFGHVGSSESASKIKGNKIALFANFRNSLLIPDFVHQTVPTMLKELFKQGTITKEESENKNMSNQELRNLLNSKGYDSIIYENKAEKGGFSYGFINPNQIKSATDNIGTFSTENDDIQMAVNNPYSKEHPYRNKIKGTKAQRREILSIIKSKRYNNSGTDVVTLKVDGHKYAYVIDHSSHALLEENQKENTKQGITTDLFGIRKKFNIKKLTENDIRYIARNVAGDYGGSEASIQHRLQELGITPEQLPGIDIVAAIQRGIGDYGKMDAETGEVGEQAISDRSGINSGENQGDLHYYLLRTPEGETEVYGFIDPETFEMYLDEDIINPEHPIHEYTHLWDRAVWQRNPDLWNRGVELMKKFKVDGELLWDKILKDPNYGLKWQQKVKKGKMKQEKMDFLVASEVHARIVGENGQAFIEKYAEENGADNLIGKLKKWILDVWNSLAKTFGGFEPEDLAKLTLADFNHMTIRDLMEGTPLELKAATAPTAQDTAIAEKPTAERVFETVKGKDILIPTVDRGGEEDEVLAEIIGVNKTDFGYRVEMLIEGKALPVLFDVDENFQNINKDSKYKSFSVYNIDGDVNKSMPLGDYISEAIKPEDFRLSDMNAPETQSQPKLPVSLPNLESYTQGIGENLGQVEVDAQWKVAQLQKLDKEISPDNAQSHNEDIVDKMKAILRAKTEKDVKSETKNQRRLRTYKRLNDQINNLQDSKLISSAETRHVAELIVNAISDMITEIKQNPELVKEYFPNLTFNYDFANASRKDVVTTIGFENVIGYVQDKFDPENQPDFYDDLDDTDRYDLLLDNWDALMHFASDYFIMNEGFGIKKDYLRDKYQVAESEKLGSDDYNNYQDTDSVREREGDAQEHWQIESRTIDTLNSMSELVRLAIHQCYQIDKDGNIVMHKFGIPERVDKREAVQSILSWTQGALNLQEMIDKLSAQKADNPWLQQLIDRLTDNSGNNADFQSQFFGVFNKHFQRYSIVRNKKGEWVSMVVNEHPAKTIMMRTIKSKYKLGEHPLFYSNGEINKSSLDALDSYYKGLIMIGSKQADNGSTVMLKERLKHEEVELSDAERQNAVKYLKATSKLLGLDIQDEILSKVATIDTLANTTMLSKLNFMIKDLTQAYETKQQDYDPFKYGAKNSIDGTLNEFLNPISNVLQNTSINSFYDDGKMYQSYVIPSFMTKLMAKLNSPDYTKVMEDEYGASEWFRNKNGEWRTEWMRWLYKRSTEHTPIAHKVELNFNKHNYMRTMDDNEYALSLVTEYFSEQKGKRGTGKELVPAWFRVPMLSNKPSSEFIRFYSHRGSDYKDKIVNGLFEIYCQELSRIQTVRMRNKEKNSIGFIKNFDTKGREFCFLPDLNYFLKNDHSYTTVYTDANGVASIEIPTKKLHDLLQKKIESNEEMKPGEDAELIKLVKDVIRGSMEGRTQSILEDWENKGILKAAEKISGIGKSKEDVRAKVENFLWNDNYASKNILQLTIGDIAFYKDAEDLQKRLAQIHAPGIRANIDATDYEGQRVSDGKYRTFILQDWDNFKSNIIANITEVFNKKIKEAPKSQQKQLIALRDDLVRPPKTFGEDDKGGIYWNINVADAQGYSSPTSYRKKAFMFGKWSREAEDIYQKLLKGEYNYTDLKTAFQPLKPFVYSRLKKGTGVEKAPISTVFTPFQAKNAEYLLIMADAITRNESLSRPNLLKAIYDVMEDSAYDGRERDALGNITKQGTYNRKGIDTVQFASAIKSTLQSPINIHEFVNTEGGYVSAYTRMRNSLYKLNQETGERKIDSSNYDTDNVVHEASFEDYCLQQEVPEHFKDHEQAHGSQERMIIPSDLDVYVREDLTEEEKLDDENKVWYEWDEIDKNGKKVHRKEDAIKFRREYEETISDNIETSLENLSKELHLDSEDRMERNMILSEILQKEIMDSPRYGIDLFQACSIDPKTGEFRIPKGDPVQSKRIEQLINSLIKNRVNKQTIAGGPIVQVSNFGTSKQLHIRFHDKQGNILLTEEEFSQQASTLPKQYKSYKDYCAENQAGIAYFECFAPIWSDELVEKFGRPDGTIDIEAMKNLDSELLKMISYRIPTEDKYSIAPMKIVGFLPREAGDAIMLPYDLTSIDGSDFDVDKRYVMRKQIKIERDWSKKFNKKKELTDKLITSYKKSHNGEISREMTQKLIMEVEAIVESPQSYKDTQNPLQQAIYAEFEKYFPLKTVHYTGGKEFRDNKILDMTWGILTHERTASQILNPGGFEEQKKMGYMVSAYQNPANRKYTWEQLQEMDVDELKELSYVEKDLTWADTQLSFYHQNNAGSSLIGVFAVNKVAHATLESDGIFADMEIICKGDAPVIAGFDFNIHNELDKKLNVNGNLIGKVLGSLVAASADTAKDPVLDLMNINMTTAGMLNTMLRFGMPFQDAALFLSQNSIKRLLSEFNKRKLSGDFSSLESLVNEWLTKYKKDNNISDDSPVNSMPITRDELLDGIRGEQQRSTDYKVLNAFLKLRSLANEVRKPTFVTRFNSISAAVGPLIVDNLILKHKMDIFDTSKGYASPFYRNGNKKDVVDIHTILEKHPILNSFSKTVDVTMGNGAKPGLFSDMVAGSNAFDAFLNNMESEYGEEFMDKFYKDKKLFDQLITFYESYMIAAEDLVDPSKLRYYIEDFPKEFFKQNIKKQYPDNALIQAIELISSESTGRVFLDIQIAGMDAQEKENLSSAWLDLHKANPELSKKLFDYCFFRAGAGFSPKTFMSLINTYVKERIFNTINNGVKISYVDVFRNIETYDAEDVIDQFVRNNWDNSKLVPMYDHNISENLDMLSISDSKDLSKLKRSPYIKTKLGAKGDRLALWKLVDVIQPDMYHEEYIYKRTEPLGDNKEYLEINPTAAIKPMTDTNNITETMDEEGPQFFMEYTSSMETDVESMTDMESESQDVEQSITQQSKNATEIARQLMREVDDFSMEETESKGKERELTNEKFTEELNKTLKSKGIIVDEKRLKQETDKYC